MLVLPVDFSRSNGLMNRECEIILLHEDGKPWTVFLKYHKTRRRVYNKSGWRSFYRSNRKRANVLLAFKLVQTGTKPVLRLCSSYNRDCLRASSSSSSSSSTSQDRFLTVTFTPSILKNSNLCLPRKFVWLNGIENARTITLVDRLGFKRITRLEADKKCGRMRLGKECREFCEANGVKAGESFKLELIEEEKDTATHLLKFCSKVLNSP